uniref:Uncharacterized protein n=1 Tax=Rhizophora mucronata TaxID=61149 RepID=A0A2P2QF30_RHIMU
MDGGDFLRYFAKNIGEWKLVRKSSYCLPPISP